jgi:aryl-alcohol dehydrogenase-like predicted oxidoreductase
MEAYGIARREHLTPPLMEQPLYNMFDRDRVEKDLVHLYDEFGLGTTIFSPLASGLLSGKYNNGIPEGARASLKGYEWIREEIESETGRQRIEKVQRLVPISEELGCSMSQLALAWCLKNPHVSTVITGASKPEQVRENMKALEIAPKLTTEVMDRIEAILDNKPEPESDYR